MNKRLIVVTVMCLLASGVIAGSVYGRGVPRPVGVDPNRYVENPAPVFTDNSHLPEVALLGKEKIQAALEIPAGAKLQGLDRMTWGAYAAAQGNGTAHNIAPGRQVWVMKATFPTYEHPRLGQVDNAEVTLVYDAETGQLLNKKIVGIPKVAPFPSQRNR